MFQLISHIVIFHEFIFTLSDHWIICGAFRVFHNDRERDFTRTIVLHCAFNIETIRTGWVRNRIVAIESEPTTVTDLSVRAPGVANVSRRTWVQADTLTSVTKLTAGRICVVGI